MLRNRIVNGQKATDATYVAHADLKRGMVVAKGANGKTEFVSNLEAGTMLNIFIVDRDNLPEGIETVYADRPDTYFDDIKEGSYVLLRPYVMGESFYTDQYVAEAEVDGTPLCAGSDGKFIKNTGDFSKFVSRGTETVAGVKMLIVEVLM